MTKEEQGEAARKRKAEQERLKQVVNIVLRTKEGQELVTYLCKTAGFHDTGVALDPRTGLIDTESTAYNTARRVPYMLLRRLADPELLIPVELPKRTEEEAE